MELKDLAEVGRLERIRDTLKRDGQALREVVGGRVEVAFCHAAVEGACSPSSRRIGLNKDGTTARAVLCLLSAYVEAALEENKNQLARLGVTV